MNIVDQLVKVALLGATWVLYLLFLLSVASVAAMLERWIFYRRNNKGSDQLSIDLGRLVRARDEDGIAETLSRSRTIEADVLREAWPFRDGGPAAFSDAVDSELASARAKLDRNATLLGTIGNNAPFIGLFGTVLGVIEAFSYLGVGGDAAMGNVMSGIAEALVATAVGIFVAIPSVIGYNVSQKKSGDIEVRVQSLAKLLSAFLRVRPERPAEAAVPGAEDEEEDEAPSVSRLELRTSAAVAGGD